MTASLAASLLDRSAKRLSVALAVGERAPAQTEARTATGSENGALFFVKGKATAEQFIHVRRATGAQQFMRSTSSYSFTPGTTSTRKFRVIAEAGSLARLTIQDIAVEPSSRA